MLGQELKKRVHGKERCLWKPHSEEEKKREGNLESYKTKGNQKIGGRVGGRKVEKEGRLFLLPPPPLH